MLYYDDTLRTAKRMKNKRSHHSPVQEQSGGAGRRVRGGANRVGPDGALGEAAHEIQLVDGQGEAGVQVDRADGPGLLQLGQVLRARVAEVVVSESGRCLGRYVLDYFYRVGIVSGKLLLPAF